ncbi:MAG TPA: hypothetical protein VHM20_02385 [Gammaproteobacteria bacterium]|jgi:hypothetical protein|nr:hypothetical protein [Gammaproteobacteria bacterium]
MNLNRKTKKITVRFPKRLKSEMQAALIKSGYGLHGKSRWLKEAIIALLKLKDFVEYVDQGISINQAELSEVEAFYFDIETIQLLKSAYLQIRAQNPLFEGPQSALIRAAVIYHLMLN